MDCSKSRSEATKINDRAEWQLRSFCPVNGLKLSKQDCQIIRLIADGLTVKAVANELFLTANTIKTHLRKIYIRMRVTTHAQLVAESFRLGILAWERRG